MLFWYRAKKKKKKQKKRIYCGGYLANFRHTRIFGELVYWAAGGFPKVRNKKQQLFYLKCWKKISIIKNSNF